MEEIEKKECYDHGNHDSESDNHRHPPVAHEKSAHKKDKHKTQDQVLTQVAYREIEKFRLAAGLGYRDVGILGGEIFYGALNRFVKVCHA